MDFNQILQDILQWLSTSGVKLVLGLVVFVIACKIVNSFTKRLKKRMEKKNVEKTVVSVTYKVLRTGLKLLLFVLLLGFWGIDTSGIGALIASAGVAIGLAMQGSLSNLAGGILIVVLRPFRLGDYIEAQGEEGTVEEISIFYTYLVTARQQDHYDPQRFPFERQHHELFYQKRAPRRFALFRELRGGFRTRESRHSGRDIQKRNDTERACPVGKSQDARREFDRHRNARLGGKRRLLERLFPDAGGREKAFRRGRHIHSLSAAGRSPR